MQFNIDMSKVVKIVLEKDENTFIEYSIDNGTIVNAEITKKEETIEEKVDALKKNNDDVKKISKLIQFDNAGILDKMAQNGSESVFDTIKNEIMTNEIKEPNIAKADDKVIKEITDKQQKAKEIMFLDKVGILDDVAKENREKIAEKVFSKDELEDAQQNVSNKPTEETVSKVDTIDDALKIKDREQRINYLKDVVSKLNTKEY